MIVRRVAALAVLNVVPIIYLSYLAGMISRHAVITPDYLLNLFWILPYEGAAIEWVRLGSRLSLATRSIIVLTSLIAFGFLTIA
jgi:hypothetical protein